MREEPATQIVGRYALYGEIAAGGMATVHFGRLLGPAGFSRTVAIKRLHPGFAKDPEFVSMFLDEARLAARIRHPNVVPTLDVVATSGELFLVMDYVQGESLGRLVRSMSLVNSSTSPSIAASIISSVLHGLHSAHEATSERGEPLGIVHRDVSPQNILVGTDGIARVLDFGVAKAVGRLQTTREGQIKGKLAYMPPEQLRGGEMTRQADIYATAVVLWETLTSKRLFSGDNEGVIVAKILESKVERPSRIVPGLSKAYDDLVMRGLSRDVSKRFGTAREMALALERCGPMAPPSEIGAWVEAMAKTVLTVRANRIADIESSSSSLTLEPASLVEASTKTGNSSPNFLDYVRSSSQTKSASIPALNKSTYEGGDRPTERLDSGGHISSASRSSGLPRFEDPDQAEGEGMGTGTGAQLSNMSLSRSRTLRPSAGAKLGWKVGLAFVAAIALGLFIGSYVVSRPSAVGTPLAPASDSAPLAVRTVPEEAGTPWAPVVSDGGSDPGARHASGAGVGTAAVATTADPGGAALAQPVHHSHPHGNPVVKPPPAVQPPQGGGPSKDCDPPFTLDEEGHKKYKLNCFPQ